MVFGAVLGSAAALDITNGGVAQYGQDFDLSCDENGVTVEGYMLDTDADGESLSSGVKVVGISNNCIGRTLVAGVSKSSGAALARGAATIVDTGAGENELVIPYNIDGGPTVPVADIGGVRLTIG